MPILRALLSAVMLMPASASAVDGALDPSFANGNGAIFPSYAYIGNPVVDNSARGIAIGADQRITVVGDFLQDANGDDRDCGLLRTLPDASGYDPSFLPPNGYGYYVFNRGGPNTDYCHGVALDDSGRGYLVGSATLDHSGARTGLIVRFAANGTPDYSFFGDGTFESHADASTTLGAEDAEFRQVLIDTQGRIVVSGDASILTLDGVASIGVVLRFDANGVPDPGFFAGSSVARIPNAADGSSLYVAASALAVDGGYWLAGHHQPAAAPAEGRLYRITAQGAFDLAVGGSSGMAVPYCQLVQSMAIDDHGRVLLGCIPSSPTLLPGVLRLAFGPSGWAPDLSFGIDGYAELRISPGDSPGLWPTVTRVAAIQVADGGRLLVAGAYDPGRIMYNPRDLFAARLTSNGDKDTTFGSDGVVRYRFGVGVDRHDDAATAMTLDAAGRPLVVGRRVSSDTGASTYIVARLTQQPDALFHDGFEVL